MDDKTNLYLVQDPDRPLYVLASSWTIALRKWKGVIALENDIPVSDVEEPQGIQLICENNDLVCVEENDLGAVLIRVHNQGLRGLAQGRASEGML
ncbi:hypothetical protein LCGC14_1362420 [marine sediment metagenome]|uniref:Uncharacterized protein n=1 Tax=marine sediment metagenome TaxID=412755 RepID=A0A0F9MN07_9ZZZZ